MSEFISIFVLGIWAETLLYGISLSSYMLALYITLSPDGLGSSQGQAARKGHVNTLLIVSTVMNIVSTAHLAFNCYRYLLAFRGDSSGDTLEYTLTILTTWHRATKEALFVIQELLGSSVVLYRAWIVWDRNYKIVLLPITILLAQAATGFTLLGFFASKQPLVPTDVDTWIIAYTFTLSPLNMGTTLLIVFRIWSTIRSSSQYFTSKLAPITRIMIESAVLQLIAEVLLLVVYCARSSTYIIFLDAVIPITGITFNALTIRIKLHNLKEEHFNAEPGSLLSAIYPPTIGSPPARVFQASDSVSQDKELQTFPDSGSESTRRGSVDIGTQRLTDETNDGIAMRGFEDDGPSHQSRRDGDLSPQLAR